MPIEVEEPLPTGIWLSELRKLAESIANDNGASEDRAVRRAYHVSRLSPPPIARIWHSALSEGDLEALLEQGKVQEAAREIVRNGSAVDLSLSGSGRRHVAVLRYADDAPVEAEAATPALAMISAWARLLTAAG